MHGLYSFLTRLIAPLAFVVVLWRGLRDRSYWQALRERFAWGPVAGPVPVGPGAQQTPCIWLHAVSLGEVSAAAALVRALQARYPAVPLAMTTATPSGRARALSLFGDALSVRYLPYDTPGAVRRFLQRLQPRLAIIMETELWPNLYRECRRRGVPLLLASARIAEKSAARYRRFGSLFRNTLASNVVIAAQSAADAQRFLALGASQNHVHVIGNVKFDVDVSADVIAQGRALRAQYGIDRPIWIAGSTHAGEEEPLLNAHAALRTQLPNALLLLVPRHAQRFEAVAELLERRGITFIRRSSGIGSSSFDGVLRADTQVVLVDTVGELMSLYAAADIAFVGGSLVPIGGHNLLEPAAHGMPVLTGLQNFNAPQIAQLLLDEGAALAVANAEELAVTLQQLFSDPARCRRIGAIGRRTVELNRGSVNRLLELIEPWVAGTP